MTAPLPSHLAGLPQPVRVAIVAAAARDHRLNPPPPLSDATREALRVLLRRPAGQPNRKTA